MTELLPDHAIIDGHRIACGVHGEGLPVVLIHGTPSHSFIWRNVVPRLAAAGVRVHLFDLLGFGQSERPHNADTSVAGQGAVLEGLLDQWGLEQVHIVAHDIGGAVALRFAVARPERVLSLTVIDTVSYDSWPSETWRRIIRDHLDDYAAMPEREFSQLLTRQLRMTVFDKARMAGDVLEAYLAPLLGPFGQASFFQHQVRHYDSRYTEEITADLARLSMPVQILWGEADEWQPVGYGRRLAKDISGAALHIVPNAGHFLMEDAPDAVADHVLGFLGRGAG
ncbi:MAG: alpha/beta hydrolase [Kiloniellales bacterium]|jgi:pimeloyl-ACP methyl ester carboxylesterase